MTTRRTEILDAFKTHLDQLDSIERVYKQYRYIDEVNDFPAITFIGRRETRDHRGDGKKLATLGIALRLYIYDRDIAELDLRMRQVEDQIDTFAAAQRALQVELVQVVTVETDEGLMRPYQIGDMNILITYEVEA